MQLDSLIEQGLNVPKPSYNQANLPSDITVLSGDELAETFTILTGWADYISSQLTQSQLAERAAERALERKRNLLLVERMGTVTKADKMTLIKAQIATDPEILDLEDVYEKRYAYRKMLEMMLTNQERDITLVSREITRRTSEQRRRDI